MVEKKKKKKKKYDEITPPFENRLLFNLKLDRERALCEKIFNIFMNSPIIVATNEWLKVKSSFYCMKIFSFIM